MMNNHYYQRTPSGEVLPGGIELDVGQMVFSKELQSRRLTLFLTEQFNHLFKVAIPDFHKSRVYSSPQMTVTLENFRVMKPYHGTPDEFGLTRNLYPMYAMKNGMSYEGSSYIDIVTYINSASGERIISNRETVPLGKIAIMVGSEFCHLNGLSDEELISVGTDPREPFGYFIIDGTPKFLYSLDNAAINLNLVYEQESLVSRILYEVPSGITREVKIQYKNGKIDRSGEKKRSVSRPVPVFLFILPDPNKEYKERKGKKDKTEISDILNAEVNIFLLYELFGINVDDVENHIRPFLKLDPRKQQEALNLLSATRSSYTGKDESISRVMESLKTQTYTKVEMVSIIKNSLFPMLPVGNVIPISDKKIITLSSTIGDLLTKIISGDRNNRDLYANKYIKTQVRQLLVIYTCNWKREESIDAKGNLTKPTYDSVVGIGKSVCSSIYKKLKSTTPKVGGKGIKNIVRTFKDTDPLVKESELMIIDSPTSKQDNHMSIRTVANDGAMFLCPHTTVDSARAGLIKMLTVHCQITVGNQFYLSDDIISDIVQRLSKFRTSKHTHLLIINGSLIGYCSPSIRNYFVKLRRSGIKELSVAVLDHLNKYAPSHVIVKTDSGRLMVPLLVVESGSLVLDRLGNLDKHSFQSILDSGCVEYIDVLEATTHSIVAKSPMDLEHSKKVRESSMARMRYYTKGSQEWLDAKEEYQSLKQYTHCQYSVDVFVSVLASDIGMADKNYPNRVAGQVGKESQGYGIPNIMYNQMSSGSVKGIYAPQVGIAQAGLSIISNRNTDVGHHVYIAFASYSSQGMSDSIIFNRSFIDRGGLRGWEEITKVVQFNVEKGTTGSNINSLYRPDDAPYLTKDGKPRVGQIIYMDQKLVGLKSQDGDASITLTEVDSAVVTAVYTQIIKGAQSLVIKLAYHHIMGMGSKFGQKPSQKTTASILVSDVDMFFDEITGMTPDAIFSAISIPGRGTMMLIWQMLCNIVGSYTGTYQSIASGVEPDFDYMYEFLTSIGATDFGTRQMVNGITGELIDGRIFAAPNLGQLNIHTTSKKHFSRALGKTDVATGEPVKGRQKAGCRSLKNAEQVNFAHSTAQADRVSYGISPNHRATLICSRCSSTHLEQRKIVSESETTIKSVCLWCDSNETEVVQMPGYLSHVNSLVSMTGLENRLVRTGTDPYKIPEYSLERESVGIPKYNDVLIKSQSMPKPPVRERGKRGRTQIQRGMKTPRVIGTTH